MHKKNLKTIYFDKTDMYPDIGNYVVLIRDTSKEVVYNYGISTKDIKDYIERLVTEAIEMEFEAYKMLPIILEDEKLDSLFCYSGPAKKEILHVIYQHKERGWVLSNYMNPSTKRILGLRVKNITKKEVFVSTTEYWYLRWWDSKKKCYTFPYRETSRQLYVLRKIQGKWKVYEVVRPAPRTSIPNRRKYLKKK